MIGGGTQHTTRGTNAAQIGSTQRPLAFPPQQRSARRVAGDAAERRSRFSGGTRKTLRPSDWFNAATLGLPAAATFSPTLCWRCSVDPILAAERANTFLPAFELLGWAFASISCVNVSHY
jgi:hypothetical protein